MLWINVGLISFNPYLLFFTVLYLVTAIIISCAMCNKESLPHRKCAYTAYLVMFIIDCVIMVIVLILFATNPFTAWLIPGSLVYDGITIGIRVWFLCCLKAWVDDLEFGDTAPAAVRPAPAAPSINIFVQNINTNTNTYNR